MATTIIVYIIYAFILYSVYCFGMGAKTENIEQLQATSRVIRLLFFIKSSILMIHAYYNHGSLGVQEVILYGLDTLFAFIFTNFVLISLESPIIFIKKRNMLRK